MIKIFQKEWFGIDFVDLGVSLSLKQVAGVSFYSAFYREFYKRYHGYTDLPESWCSSKNELVVHINELVEGQSRVLSIGCGVGYIESKLCDFNKSLDIVAIEPSVDMTQWVNEKVNVLHGLFPEVIENKYSSAQFDLVYAASIDYLFDNKSYELFLTSLVNFGVCDFLLTEIFIPENGFLPHLKSMYRKLQYLLGFRKGYQFWGYLRETDEHIRHLKKAGFSKFETGKYSHGTYWIRAQR